LLVKDDAVISGIRLGQNREFSGGSPVEPAALNDHTADGDAVAPIHLVVEFMTMSAPSSIGRLR